MLVQLVNMTGLVKLFFVVALLYWLLRRFFPLTDILGIVRHTLKSWERRLAQYQLLTSKHARLTSSNKYINNNKQWKQPAFNTKSIMFDYGRNSTTHTLRQYELDQQHKTSAAFRIENDPKRYRRSVSRQRSKLETCCGSCTTSAVPRAHIKNDGQVHNVLDIRDEGSIIRRYFKHVVHNINLIKFPYPRMYNEVLKDQRVKDAILKAAERDIHDNNIETAQLGNLIKKHEKRAKEILNIMKSKLSDLMLRLTSWVLYKILPIFLDGVLVSKKDIEMIQETEKKGLPLIFLPQHRSHLDYILLTFILMNNGVKAPIVAAGDNLIIPVFGWLLRGLGAFYIKRKIDPITGGRDLVYRAVLHTYMVENLRAGHYVEFYIEGGRTRTGKTCMPKGGLLSVIVDAASENVIEDAIIIPVSINYERIVDGNFIREQLGQLKVMETFSKACRAIWIMLNAKYGVMRVDFSAPFSVKEMVDNYQQNGRGNSVTADSVDAMKELPRPPSTASIYGTDVVVEEQRNVVDIIARHVIYDCDRHMSIMSTNALAFILLYQFRNGGTLDELSTALDELRLDARFHEREMGFSENDDSVDVITHALSVLGPGLVQRERITTSTGDTIFIKPATIVPNIIELTYYANGTMVLYILESVIATAMCSLQPKSTWSQNCDAVATKNELMESVKFLCTVLQFEFILCKPCQKLEQVTSDVLDSMFNRNLLISEARSADAEPESSDEADDYVDLEDVKFLMNAEHRNKFRLLCNMLRPLLEGYYATVATLPNLVGREITERDLLADVRCEIELRLKSGKFLYEESLSADPMKNALRLLQKLDVLECTLFDREKIYFLKKDVKTDNEHDAIEDRLNPIIRRLRSLVCVVE